MAGEEKESMASRYIRDPRVTTIQLNSTLLLFLTLNTKEPEENEEGGGVKTKKEAKLSKGHFREDGHKIFLSYIHSTVY